MIDINQKGFIFLDGAFGTELQKRGLRPGEVPELWNMTRPNAIKQIHKSYLSAGSDILYANTFGCSEKRLAGSGYTVEEVAARAVELAQSVCKNKALVALDIGPLGELLYPNGSLTFSDAYDQFKRLAVAGEAAGADLAVVETMTDLAEARAAVLAVQENTALPVFVTMSFDRGGRTFFGCTAESFAATFSDMGIRALGINCSLGPVEALPIVQRIAAVTDLPLIVKPNAGLPDPETGAYPVSPTDFALAMRAFADLGVKYLGGCCGTDPDYIKILRHAFRDLNLKSRWGQPDTAVCSPTVFTPLAPPLLVSDRLDPRRCGEMAEALADDDPDAVGDLALDQMDSGVQLLRLALPADGEDKLAQAVAAVQAVCKLPLLIEGHDPQALEAALRAYQGKCILSGPLDAALPLAKKYGAVLLIRPEGDVGVPETAETRLELAQQISEAAQAQGIPKWNLAVDCMALPLSGAPLGVNPTLQTIHLVKEVLGLKTYLDLTGVGEGLPESTLLSCNFLTLALGAGLDLALIDPEAPAYLDFAAAFRALSGTDADCADYITRFGKGD